MIDIDIDKT